VNWAVESNLDRALARSGSTGSRSGLRNLAHKGDRFIPFDNAGRRRLDQAVRAGRGADRVGEPVPPGRGRRDRRSASESAADHGTLRIPRFRLLADGSAVVYAGDVRHGAGRHAPCFAQIVSTELGVPLDWVTVVMGDTAVVSYDQQTSASRSTVLMGNAVLLACRGIQAKLRVMSARLNGPR